MERRSLPLRGREAVLLIGLPAGSGLILRLLGAPVPLLLLVFTVAVLIALLAIARHRAARGERGPW